MFVASPKRRLRFHARLCGALGADGWQLRLRSRATRSSRIAAAGAAGGLRDSSPSAAPVSPPPLGGGERRTAVRRRFRRDRAGRGGATGVSTSQTAPHGRRSVTEASRTPKARMTPLWPASMIRCVAPPYQSGAVNLVGNDRPTISTDRCRALRELIPLEFEDGLPKYVEALEKLLVLVGRPGLTSPSTTVPVVVATV